MVLKETSFWKAGIGSFYLFYSASEKAWFVGRVEEVHESYYNKKGLVVTVFSSTDPSSYGREWVSEGDEVYELPKFIGGDK